MIDNGFEPDQYMRKRIVLMHVKCGVMVDACRLFDEMLERDAALWNEYSNCTSEQTSLQIVQRNRVCGDCDSAIKMIAKITKREMVIRDASRFHRFRDGSCCSFGD
ncbi:Pentatricopeptide repeat-containing protein, partial [Cucurbita argyrosperma subsp. sororia]